MASSSVSQESLDTVDYAEQSARKSKIRSLRAKGVLPRSNERELEPADKDLNGDDGFNGEPHESPSRGVVGRMKDKRTRPSHLHKGKMALKDKRKLREKRRSTGVVHLQSTEVNCNRGGGVIFFAIKAQRRDARVATNNYKSREPGWVIKC